MERKYKISYTRHGKDIVLYRTAETAEKALDTICDQYDWRLTRLMIDADTRGMEWAHCWAYTCSDRSGDEWIEMLAERIGGTA